MRHIVVVAYDPGWQQAFSLEAERLREILGDMVQEIHHIGSTAVPGLWAKPIIDMLLIVRSVLNLDAYDPAFIAWGYEPLGENGIPGRRFFRKGGDEHRSHHVHAYEPDHPEVARHLDFRDYLLAHAQTRDAYGQLKIDLASQYPYDIGGYVGGKDTFIKEVITLAQIWRQTQE